MGTIHIYQLNCQPHISIVLSILLTHYEYYKNTGQTEENMFYQVQKCHQKILTEATFMAKKIKNVIFI